MLKFPRFTQLIAIEPSPKAAAQRSGAVDEKRKLLETLVRLQRNSLALIVKLPREVHTDSFKLIVNVAAIVRSRKALAATFTISSSQHRCNIARITLSEL